MGSGPGATWPGSPGRSTRKTARLGARWKAAPRAASASATGSSEGGASRASAAASQQKTWSSPTSSSCVGRLRYYGGATWQTASPGVRRATERPSGPAARANRAAALWRYGRPRSQVTGGSASPVTSSRTYWCTATLPTSKRRAAAAASSQLSRSRRAKRSSRATARALPGVRGPGALPPWPFLPRPPLALASRSTARLRTHLLTMGVARLRRAARAAALRGTPGGYELGT